MVLKINSASEQIDVGKPDFPLAISVSADGTILFGSAAESNPVAWIGFNHDHLFIQPEDGEAAIRLNGESLKTSAWLSADDEIKLAETALAVTTDAGILVLTPAIRQRRATLVSPQTPPVENSEPSDKAGNEAPVAPIASPLPTNHARWRKLVAVLFLVLVLCAIFVLSAAPVQIAIKPTPDTMSLSGFPQPIKIGEHYLVWPGDYRVEAEKNGYRRLDKPVEVAFGEEPVLRYQMRKLPGFLNLNSTPISGAEVRVNGKVAGHTPLDRFEIEAGYHELRISAERYLPDVQSIEIKGMETSQSIDVTLQPGWGTLLITSEPDGADVQLDGVQIGQTPLRTEPMGGNHHLKLNKPGWKPNTSELQIQPGETINLPLIQLVKIDGILELKTDPPGATLLLNGDFKGYTPVSMSLVADQDHRLSLSKAGFSTLSQTVRVEGGKTRNLNIQLKPEYGTLFITSQPANAELKIDGKLKGDATGRFRLTTRSHKIEIKKMGYETFTTTLTPRVDVSKKINVQLKTIQEVKVAKAKAAARDMKTAGGQMLRGIWLTKPFRFQMGASRREAGRRANENLYEVELTRAYFISAKEVTNAEFQQFRKEHNTNLNKPDHPVTSVSWDDAARYLNWLSKKDGLPPAYREENGTVYPITPVTTGYRLPTEAEWVFAARHEGGHRTADKPLKYAWEGGLPPPRNSGNYADISVVGRILVTLQNYNDGHQETAPVGRFPPNKAGLYDLGGNVAEWCHDYYDVSPGNTAKVLQDPLGPPNGKYHTIRGSSWRHGSITELRLSYRDYAEQPRNDLGFRIARYVTETPN